MRKSIGLEEVVDVNDPNLWFYYIHEFPAYEISSPINHDIYNEKGELMYHAGSSIIRSFKSVYKYPYGLLVRPKIKANDNDPSFELTDLNNERRHVRLSQLVFMAKNLPYAVSGYPRRANMISINCRNERIFINKKLKYPELDNTTRFYPKFRIIEDDPCDVMVKNPKVTDYVRSTINVPIESIDGSEYYGRRDIRVEKWQNE